MISISPQVDTRYRLKAPNRIFFSKEFWKKIEQCKTGFLNYAEDPRNNPYVHHEIATSWIKLRDMGLNPQDSVTTGRLNPRDLEKIIKENNLLIEVTNSVIDIFRVVMYYSGYIIYLIDKNGIILLQEGDWASLPPFSEQMSLTGLIVDENMMGNSSHSLCMRLKQPVQLLGPEHYSTAFEDNIASATPIFDELGEVTASLVLLSQPLQNPSWEDSLQKLSLHTLGLVVAMGVAIESRIKLKKSNDNLIVANSNLKEANESLQTAYNTLETTLASTDEGLITIDRLGNIVRINQEAGRLFKIFPDESIGKNICEFIKDRPTVERILSGHEPVDFHEVDLIIDNNKQNFIMSIQNRFSDDLQQQWDGAVIRLTHAEKIHTLVSNRITSQTKFGFNDIIGECNEIKSAKDIAKRFALSSENILLVGESGTGKELFAQAIHNTYCQQGPFIAINCAAMPRSLIESELFGYEAGSFTGADKNGRPGKIELANGGTLFLDEIGDMPVEVQAVLLRVLEDKQVMRLGGKHYQIVDFRVVAATNRNLLQMVKENQFREDLYYRLSVLRIPIPPLRRRNNDILLLSQFFIESYCKKTGRPKPQLSPTAIKKILEYNWPGNVRQLENAIIYAINIISDNVINLEDLPYELLEGNGEFYKNTNDEDETLSLRVWEKAAIKSALLQTNNSVAQASEMLQISKSTLYRKLKEHNIDF